MKEGVPAAAGTPCSAPAGGLLDFLPMRFKRAAPSGVLQFVAAKPLRGAQPQLLEADRRDDVRVAVAIFEQAWVERSPVRLEEGAAAEGRDIGRIVEGDGEGRLPIRPIFREGVGNGSAGAAPLSGPGQFRVRTDIR
jgi:hypothetical protein